jgi:hypothetical protein
MRKIKFAVIGDSHYSTEGNYSTRDCLGAKKQVQKIVDKLNNYKLDFVFSLGDLGDGRSKSEIPEVLEVYAKSVNQSSEIIAVANLKSFPSALKECIKSELQTLHILLSYIFSSNIPIFLSNSLLIPTVSI